MNAYRYVTLGVLCLILFASCGKKKANIVGPSDPVVEISVQTLAPEAIKTNSAFIVGRITGGVETTTGYFTITPTKPPGVVQTTRQIRPDSAGVFKEWVLNLIPSEEYTYTAHARSGERDYHSANTIAFKTMAMTVVNKTPVVNAGNDTTITDTDGDGLVSFMLHAVASDSDGTIASFAWTENDSVIAQANDQIVSFAIGVHTVKVTVTDDGGATATDEVIITVKATPAPPPNQPPTVNAGPDVSKEDADGNGTETVILTATASDPDGTIVGYRWAEGATELGTSATLNRAFSVGVHAVTITVTDDDGATATDGAVVTIRQNTPPTANAGPNQRVVNQNGYGTVTARLDGSGSSDTAPGTIRSYRWTDETGTEVETGVAPIIALGIGTHRLTLTVTDNGGATATSTVTIVISAVPWTLPSSARIFDIATDGNVIFLVGATTETVDGTPNGGHDDFFVMALSGDGIRLWATQMKTADDDLGNFVAVAGGVVYALHFQSPNGIIGPRYISGFDATTGSKLWTTEIAQMDLSGGITADASGAYIVGGKTGSPSGPLVAKFSPNGTELWRNEANYNGFNYAVALHGNSVWVTGSINGALSGYTNAGMTDATITEYNASTGAKLSATQWGTPALDNMSGIAISGDIAVIVGSTVDFNIGGKYRAIGFNIQTKIIVWNTDFGGATQGLRKVATAPNGTCIAAGGGIGPIVISPTDGSFTSISPRLTVGNGGIAFLGSRILIVNESNVVHVY